MDLYEHLSRNVAATREALGISESLATKLRAKLLKPSDKVLVAAMVYLGYPVRFDLARTIRRAWPEWEEARVQAKVTSLVFDWQEEVDGA